MRLKSSTPGITVLSSTNNHGTVNSGQTVGSSSALTFSISPSITPINAAFDLEIISSSPPDTFTTSFFKFVGGVEILVVDGDDSPINGDFRSYVTRSLDSLFRPYAIWDLATQGVPGDEQLSYKYVIWYTGGLRFDISSVIGSAEIEFLREYLDQGGRLYLSGQDVAECIALGADSTFLSEYLGIRYVTDYEPLDVIGVAGNALSDNMKLRIRGQDGAANQFDSDVLQILPGANKTFDYYFNPSTFGPAGSIYARPNGSRVVFTGFGLEAVTTNFTAQGYNTQYELMNGILEFLADNVATDTDDNVDEPQLPVDFELHQNFPNPFNPTTQISFSIGSHLEGDPLCLEILNILGQRVKALRAESAVPGEHTVEFDASELPSGVYFYRLRVGASSVTRKMVFSK